MLAKQFLLPPEYYLDFPFHDYLKSLQIDVFSPHNAANRRSFI